MTKWCENDLPSMLCMSVFYCTFAFAIMLPNVSVGFLLSVSICDSSIKCEVCKLIEYRLIN